MDAIKAIQKIAPLCVLDMHLATLEAECKQFLESDLAKENQSEREDANMTASAAMYMRERVMSQLLTIAGDTTAFINY